MPDVTIEVLAKRVSELQRKLAELTELQPPAKDWLQTEA
jgi:hypothetical protein